MDRVLRALGAAAHYLVSLAGDALLYCWRCATEVVAAGRTAWLVFVRRRSPERGAEAALGLAALRQSREERWACWRAVPWQRRLQVQAAAIGVLALAVLAVRAYKRPQGRFAFARPTNGASRSSGVRPTPYQFVPNPTPTPEDPASIFHRQLEAASPGSWVQAKDVPPVLQPGPLGSWDDFKVGSPVVIEEQGGYRLWYRGCHFLGADYGCGVGHATSKDGVKWDRTPAPVFVPSDAFEREHLDAIALARDKNGFVLWYSVSTAFSPDRHRASLHVARSKDGLAWTPQAGTVYEAVAQGAHLRPAALWREDRFHVWLFDSRSVIDPSTGLFPEMPEGGDLVLIHLTSGDGASLQPVGSTPIDPLRMDPVALSINSEASGGFRALFRGQSPSTPHPEEVTMLRSPDGNTWERAAGEAMPLRDYEFDGRPVSLAAVSTPGGLFFWFVVPGTRGGEAIQVAFHKEKG